MRVLHIVPDSVLNPRKLHLGSTKDIQCRTEYFRTRDIFFDELVVENRSDSFLLAKLKQYDLSSFSAVLFEYTLYPKSLKYIRQVNPELLLVVRAHQAEFIHWLHYAAAAAKYCHSWECFKSIMGSLCRSLSRLRTDYFSARYADYVLSITDWERKHYWRYLSRFFKSLYAPYFLPQSFIENYSSVNGKKNQCVCLTSTSKKILPFHIDAIKNLSVLVAGADSQSSAWNFFVTGDKPRLPFAISNQIQFTGFLETPFEILAQSRAMALLSGFGCGFKTKIMDAIVYQCYVLLSKKIHNQLPRELKPYCMAVDLKSPSSFEAALQKCSQPYPEGDANEYLRKQAYLSMDKIFFKDCVQAML